VPIEDGHNREGSKVSCLSARGKARNKRQRKASNVSSRERRKKANMNLSAGGSIRRHKRKRKGRHKRQIQGKRVLRVEPKRSREGLRKKKRRGEVLWSGVPPEGETGEERCSESERHEQLDKRKKGK